MSEEQRQRDQDKLLRGFGHNLLGSLGRILLPAYYILANQVYGPAVFGLYALAIAPIEILTNFVVTGFTDALQKYAARDSDRDEAGDAHYAVLWRCLLWVAGTSVLSVVVVLLFGPTLAVKVWGREGMADVLLMFVLNVPVCGVMYTLLAAARAVMDMKGDALVRGFINPALLVALTLIFRPFVSTVYGLGLALTVSNFICLGFSIWYFRKHYSLRKVWRARRMPGPPGLLGFAVIQSVNMSLWNAIWNLDVVMLGAYVSNAQLGLYRTAAEIARTVFSIRYSFSRVYAPLVARYTLDNDLSGLQDSYTRLSRWISYMAAPAVVAVILYQAQILWLFNPLYGGGAAFMWLLLIGPLIACATGLSGNILVMTGHNGWNLFNSAVLVAANAALNLALIPRWGMDGAAFATMVGTTGASLLQILEVRYLLKVTVELRKLWRPFAAAGLGAGVAFAVGALVEPSIGYAATQAVKGVLFVALFVAAAIGFGFEPEDREVLAKRRAKKTKATSGSGRR